MSALTLWWWTSTSLNRLEPLLLFAGAILGLLALYVLLGRSYSLYLKLSGKKPEQSKNPHYGIMNAAYDSDDGPRRGYWRCKAERMSPSKERDGWVCVKCGKFVSFDQWYGDYKRKEERLDAEIGAWAKGALVVCGIVLLLDLLS